LVEVVVVDDACVAYSSIGSLTELLKSSERNARRTELGIECSVRV
jgi:hypothetical protein